MKNGNKTKAVFEAEMSKKLVKKIHQLIMKARIRIFSVKPRRSLG
jgi:hypothetical protein